MRTDCAREQKHNGAVWTLPCCEAAEICSVIYQPNGAGQQRLHKDGHMRYRLPNSQETLFNSFFLNVIVPLKGNIPTLFRGKDPQLHASTMCNKDEIRIFNGSLCHAGARNNSGTGVWKLFLGLVPANHPSAGDFPIFADGGKSLANEGAGPLRPCCGHKVVGRRTRRYCCTNNFIMFLYFY
jgi:hypothetical protein